MKNKVLIYGISGQDGSYLAKKYLEKRFIVHGISRKKGKWDKNLKYLDIKDKIKIFKISKNFNNLHSILKNHYKYIIHLGGQSSVIKSYSELEQETFESQILPLQIFLEKLKNQKKNKTKFMFSSSSEIFGYQKKVRLNEKSVKIPQSPYALSKLIGYEIIKSYREMFNLKVFSIIFFNHESILRDNNFVFKKISNYLIRENYKKKIELGNIDVIRDWGSSEEYMKIVLNIMSQKKIDDYILATGNSIRLKEVIKYFFKNKGLDYKKFIKINKKYLRKYEIKENYSDISKIKKNTKTYPKKGIHDLINQFLSYENG